MVKLGLLLIMQTNWDFISAVVFKWHVAVTGLRAAEEAIGRQDEVLLWKAEQRRNKREDCEYDFNQFMIVGVLHSRATGSCSPNLHCKSGSLVFSLHYRGQPHVYCAGLKQLSGTWTQDDDKQRKNNGFTGII